MFLTDYLHTLHEHTSYLVCSFHSILKRSQEEREPGSANVGRYQSKKLQEVMIRTYIDTCLESERVKVYQKFEVHVPENVSVPCKKITINKLNIKQIIDLITLICYSQACS